MVCKYICKSISRSETFFVHSDTQHKFCIKLSMFRIPTILKPYDLLHTPVQEYPILFP